MKYHTNLLSFLFFVGFAVQAQAETVFTETFESPDVSTNSTIQDGAKYKKGQLPNNGKWIGSTQGFGSDRKGLINKTFGDYSAPSGNNQGCYFGYTNTGLTSSVAAISSTLELGVTYTLSFNVGRDNNQTQSSYQMELVAFTPEQGDSVRTETRPGVKPGTILASANGTVTKNDLSTRIIFTFQPDATAHAAHIGKKIGVRFIGNSTCPVLDNVLLTQSGGAVVDSDSDGLGDAWEIANFGNLTQDGTADADNDTLTDAFEYQAHLNPNDEDSDDDGNQDWLGVYGYLGVEQWDGIQGESLSDLFTSQEFNGQADFGYYTPQAKSSSNVGDNYGLRMSGTLIAPRTGDYRFWIAGGGGCRLYLSTDSTPFNRRRIAEVTGSTAEESWNEQASQQSALVGLVAGQEYFIEVVMKEGAGADNAAVAWEYTGKPRHVIPGTYLRSFVPNAGDLDGDGMLDSWESSVGLDPGDNGSTDPGQSGYANADNDDLLNFEEYMYLRNPLLVDAPGGQQGFCEWQQFTLGNNNGLVSALTKHPSFSQNAPVSQGLYSSSESPTNVADYFGRRMRGVITIPTTGTYHFYVTGDDSATLFINPNGHSRFGKVVTAQCPGPAPVRNYASYGSQKSISYSLNQGSRIYFEVLQVDNFGADHCSVAWSGPPSVNPLVIPSAYVSTCQPETITVNGQVMENDADNDSLPDNWEIDSGLLVTNSAAASQANGEYGDPDGDGLSNFEEYRNRTHPLTANGIPSKWRHEIYHAILGDRINTLIGTSGILKGPSLVRLADSTEDFQNYNNSYGQRFRATIMPPQSGEYTFWVSGDDSVELWLSSDARKFHKRRIAYVDDNSFSGYSLTGFRQWDKAPGQRSVPVSLVGGESYYIEVLHKDWDADDHVSVAWALGAGPAGFTYLPNAASGMVTAFSNIGLLNVTSASGNISGTAQGSALNGVASCCLSNNGSTSSFQLQWVQGTETRAVKVRLDQTEKGVAASQVWARSMIGNVLGQDFDQLAGYVTVAIGSTGYGVTGLSLMGSNGALAISRDVIPSSVLTSFVRDVDDQDDDCLEDSWEEQHLGAGASAENGLNNANFGEYGDPDTDLIVNREEWLLGTDPNNADTDGDGYSDGQEVYFLGTNPLVPELSNPSVVGAAIIDAQVQSSGTWVPTADGGMLSMENRSWIDYNISVVQDGYYLFEILGRARGSAIRDREDLHLDVSVDSRKVASTVLTSLYGQQGLAAGFAGWLHAGTHTIRVFHNNLLGRRTLQLDSIRLLLPAGTSSTIQGLPDWVYDFLSAKSTVATSGGGFLVSPFCLEGKSRDWSVTSVSVDGSNSVPVNKGADAAWYANIQLNPNVPINVDIGFENGLLESTIPLEWLPFNVASGLPMRLRAGDSLRLTAHTPGSNPDGSTVSFKLDGQSIGSTAANSPMVHAFATQGIRTLEAAYTASGGVSQTATIAVEVLAADFGPTLPLYINRSRLWNLPGVPADLPLEADSTVAFGPESPNGSGRSLAVDVSELGTNTVIARSTAQGPVVASGRIHGILLSTVADNELPIIYVYPNGDRVVELTLFATSLPPGGYIRIDTALGGRAFLPSGATSLELREEDFDENGIARYRMLMSSNVGHACSRIYLYDAAGNLVGQM